MLKLFTWTTTLAVSLNFFYLPVMASSSFTKQGIDHFDEIDLYCNSRGDTFSTKKIMVIGDSLTIGATNGGLLSKLKASGFDLSTEYEEIKEGAIPRYRGKSIEATSGYSVASTLERLKLLSDSESNLSSIDVVLIGLGTNPESNLTNSISNLINYIRQKNTRLLSPSSILWVNTNHTNKSIRSSIEVNAEIKNASTANNYSVIDIASDTNLKPDASDGIHYSSTKYANRADYIVNAVKSKLNISSSGSDVGELSTEDNYKFTWDYLVNKKGLSPDAAAGLMGNLEAESGINPQNMQNNAPLPDGPVMPSVVNPRTGLLEADPAIRNKYGYGIAQWTTAGRQDKLLNDAKAQGRSSGDLGFQLDFLWSELESSSYDDVLTILKNPGVSIEEASDVVLLKFEIPASVIYMPGKESMEEHNIAKQNVINKRRELSKNIAIKYAGSTYSGGGQTRSCNTVGTGSGNGSQVGVLGGDGTIDQETGYAFPMEPQKQTGISGIQPNQQESTHHSSGPAYDLFGPGHKNNTGGDDVYAFDDGVVVSIGEDEPGWCYNIQLKADDGYYYWYGHLNNISVIEGQRVRAGQVMGETAAWTEQHTCNGSSGATHLHIDRGCTTVENGVEVKHPGGRSECRDPDFIPLLSEIYGRLPK